jgi:hypothetical protein
MNRNWERRHPCRRVAVLFRKLAGKDAGAPGMATGSWSRCMRESERRLSMNAAAADVSPLILLPEPSSS